jgi:hypothetical protein
LVLRVWIHEGDPATLRAHISQSLEVASQDYSIGVAEGTDAIVGAVRSWVDTYLARAAAGDELVTRERQTSDGQAAPSPQSAGEPVVRRFGCQA